MEGKESLDEKIVSFFQEEKEEERRKKMGRRGEKEEKRTSYKVSIELSKSHGRWEKNLSLPLPVVWNGINEDTAII